MTDSVRRREYLTRRAMEMGVPALYVEEAVSTTALAHPEWDMDEPVDPTTGEPASDAGPAPTP